jgi:hypothetical protein
MSILKVISRIFLILAAALLVVGATLALSHTSLGAQILSARGGLEDGLRNAAASTNPLPANFVPQAGGGGGDFDRAGGGSLVFDLARNLGTVGAIVLAYVAISLAFSRLKGWFKRNRSPLRSAAL